MIETTQAITQTDIEAALRASGLLDDLGGVDSEKYKNFVVGLSKDINTPLVDMFEKYKDAYTGGVAARVSPEALALLTDTAARDASKLATQLLESELRKVHNGIADGIQKGYRPDRIAKTLTDVRGLDSNRARQFEKMREYLQATDMSDEALQRAEQRAFDRLLKKRRTDIAWTEGRTAFDANEAVNAQNAGKKFKYAVTAGDARVSDTCLENEDAGLIPVNEPFPSGHMRPPFHPGGCRTACLYVADYSDERNQRIKDRAAKTRRARELDAARQKLEAA